MNRNHNLLLAALVVLSLCLIPSVFAAPSGASITSNSTDYGPTIVASSITNNRSTITTISLYAVQQDQHWKAYIGNVTGLLTLDDSTNNTIYDWTGAAPSGEVYATNASSPNFGTVNCASAGTISAAQTGMNMTASDADNIMKTFNSTSHNSTVVSGTTLSGCNMTSLYVNNASQGQNTSASFQEFLMQDAASNLVYVAIINDNKVGYNGQSFDFQMIVAESHVESPHTYYFYVELG